MKRNLALLSAAALILVMAGSALAQVTPQPFSTGLVSPVKMIFTPRGNLLVAEAGNGPNTGRISLIDRNTGERRTIISGLPSGFATVGGPPQPSGPSGLFIQGSVLYVTIGSGDAVLPGPVPGSEQLNPNRSSELFASVLAIDLPGAIESVEGGLTLNLTNQSTIKAGQPVQLGDGANSLRVRLVADFPDFRFEPLPNFSGNVRSSNPFGITGAGGNTLYVVDASFNSVRTVNLVSGATATLATFPQLTNPLPMGPPMIDAVPDSIRFINGRLLVPALTGFPFPPGAAVVFTVDPASGEIGLASVSLTTAIDVAAYTNTAGEESLLILQYSTNFLQNAPGNLLLQRQVTDEVIAGGLQNPTSMVADPVSGDIFVTELATGRVLQISAEGRIPRAFPPVVLPVVAATTGVGGAQFDTAIQLSNPHSFPISGTLLLRPVGGADPITVTYSLAANETRNFDTLAGLFGQAGVGSLEVFPSVGPPPLVTASIRETTSGNAFFVEPLGASSVLNVNQTGTLVGPPNLQQFRMNIGVRTFDEGATIRFIVYRQNGTRAIVTERTFAPNSLTQLSAAEILGTELQGNESIVIQVLSGSAIVYGSAVNNQTQASAMQIARPITLQ